MLKLVVLSCVVAAACASVIAPFAYSSPLAYSTPLAYAAPWSLAPYNYRGPLSLAPGQPANVLGSDGRPLDTLDVNLDRSAHFVAKALDSGVHLLKKRSVVAPFAYSSLAYSAPIAPFAPLAYSAPLLASSNYRGPLSLAPGQPANIIAADGRPLDTLDVNLDRSAHLVAKALDSGVHLLKKRSIVAPLAYSSLGYSAPIAPFAPLAYSAPLLAPSNYRGPLSLAPGQPANILAADGRPLDTLDVNLDRSAHFVAKALNGGVHLLKKRSAPLIAAPLALAHTPLITPASPILSRVAPFAHVTPYSAYPYASYW